MKIGRLLYRDGVAAKFIGYCKLFGRRAMRVCEIDSGKVRVWIHNRNLKSRLERDEFRRRVRKLVDSGVEQSAAEEIVKAKDGTRRHRKRKARHIEKRFGFDSKTARQLSKERTPWRRR